MTRKEDILYEAISKDTSIKKVRGFSTTYPSLCNLKLFQNIDGTWLTAQDDSGVSITIKMSDLNDFVHCENLDNNSRWKESEEKMTREEAIKRLKEARFSIQPYQYINEVLDMAIKVLEQEPFINKHCISKGVCHEDKVKALDKIRNEVKALTDGAEPDHVWNVDVFAIIDKYKVESEEYENLDNNSRWKESEEKMTREEAKEVLGDVRAYLACRAILENEILAGHTFTDICNAIKTLEQEPFINKPCISKGVCHEDKNKILDKISAEIEREEDWLACAGYNAYNVYIAFNSLKLLVKESRDNE